MAIEKLNDDLLVEILSRVPAKSLCRFKCVCKYWLDLIHHADHQKKLPQTLAGFVYRATEESLTESSFHFITLSGSCRDLVDTSFAFLPNHRRVNLLDCCNGLLLFRRFPARGDTGGYIVCNPATGEWVMLPERELGNASKVSIARLGFDPAVSSSFYVFLLLENVPRDYCLTKVDVYSSGTGRWTRKEKTWNENIGLLPSQYQPPSIFLNGRMHFHPFGTNSALCLVAVDAEGKTWTTFRAPAGLYGNGSFLQQSHGCLHYCSFQRDEDCAMDRLVVYVLKDYGNKDWMLKHSVQTSHMSGGGGTQRIGYCWMVIHPDCDLIFFTKELDTSTKFMCYNMDLRQLKVVSNLEYGNPHYLPYVPFYVAPLQSLHS